MVGRRSKRGNTISKRAGTRKIDYGRMRGICYTCEESIEVVKTRNKKTKKGIYRDLHS